MVGGGAGMQLRGWWWWGSAFANTRPEGALGAKSNKSECGGLIWDAPCQMAVEGDGRMWCCCVVETVVVVGLCIRETWGGWTAKPKIELPWLDFRLQWGC